MNWISLKFNDQNKEIEYLESRTFDKLIKFRKVIYLTLAFNCAEIIKEITLSAINLIPFASFWFFFGFSIMCLGTLVLSYKMKNSLQLINLASLVFLCFFYTFCYYYIDNIEFSFFMVVVLYTYSLYGTYVRLIVSISVVFLVLHINILNANFGRIRSV